MKETIYHRSADKLLEDCLFPQGFQFDPEVDARHAAIGEVLRRIPEEDHRKLADDLFGTFEWFIPHPETRGMVMPFFATVYPGQEKLAPYCQVIYLSPSL